MRCLGFDGPFSAARRLSALLTILTTLFFIGLLFFMLLTCQCASEITSARCGDRGMDRTPVGSMAPPSPFYLHYVRFRSDNGERTLRFTDYLRILFGLQYLKPDAVLVHGDFEPEGEYWDQLKSRGAVRHVPSNKTTVVGQRLGRPKTIAFLQHSADMAKLDVLLEYGGVVADFDVFFIRGERIREILSSKAAVLCFGDVDGHNMGLVAGYINSQLLSAWRQSYRDIYAPDWNFNQGFVAKYLAILFSAEVYVADKICNNPHPDRQLGYFFHGYGKIDWKNSIAIHSYERYGGLLIDSPADLGGDLTTHKELHNAIYLNLSLPPVDVHFVNEIDPFSSALL